MNVSTSDIHSIARSARRVRPALVIAAMATVIAALPATQASAATVIVIDVPGATSTTAYGINTAGDVVGGYVDGGGDEHGFAGSGF